MGKIELRPPLSEKDILLLRAWDRVYLSGVVYSARDAAHNLIVQALEGGRALPFPLSGQVIYYLAPTPAPPGRAIGSAGPTSSYRLDKSTIPLLKAGVKAFIGKGPRSPEIKKAFKKYHAIYLTTFAGAGAFLSQFIKEAEVAAFHELGPEAVLRLKVKELPLIVVNDAYGGDLYDEGRAKYSLKP